MDITTINKYPKEASVNPYKNEKDLKPQRPQRKGLITQKKLVFNRYIRNIHSITIGYKHNILTKVFSPGRQQDHVKTSKFII
jgi:hypothetical protein